MEPRRVALDIAWRRRAKRGERPPVIAADLRK